MPGADLSRVLGYYKNDDNLELYVVGFGVEGPHEVEAFGVSRPLGQTLRRKVRGFGA